MQGHSVVVLALTLALARQCGGALAAVSCAPRRAALGIKMRALLAGLVLALAVIAF